MDKMTSGELDTDADAPAHSDGFDIANSSMATPAMQSLGISIGLLVLTSLVYSQVREFELLAWDDQVYVSQNPQIDELSGESIEWAFSTNRAYNWHPMTWISFMLEIALFGKDSTVFHLTNVVLHGANTVLVFRLLRTLSGATWRSAFVAAVFSVHPLHAESVAWVAERKDVLSVFFGLFALLSYARFATKQSRRPRLAYFISLLAFLASLLSKQTLVTLPCLLLVLDWWPLQRVHSWNARMIEKLPFFALAATFSVVVYLVQAPGEVQGDTVFPLHVRVLNAALAYGLYLKQSFVPIDLAAFYPHPGRSISIVMVCLASAVLGFVTVVAWKLRESRPGLLAGWFWYLGTLVPVIGLVQVGEQQRADRYMYFPLIGLAIAVAWSFRGRLHRLGIWCSAGAAIGAIGVLAILAHRQVATWRNTMTLFTHASLVTERNYVAETGMGDALYNSGRVTDAIRHYRRALVIEPKYSPAHRALGNALSRIGEYNSAETHYRAVLKRHPNDAQTLGDLGHSLLEQRRYDEAESILRKAASIAPQAPPVRTDLARVLIALDRPREALEELRVALQVDGKFAAAHFAAGIALEKVGRLEDSVHHFETALSLAPNDASARRNAIRMHLNLASVAGGIGRYAEAVSHGRRALKLSPSGPQAYLAHLVLARTYDLQNLPASAGRAFRRAVDARPESVEVRLSYADFLLKRHRRQAGAVQIRTAEKLKPNDPEVRKALKKAGLE